MPRVVRMPAWLGRGRWVGGGGQDYQNSQKGKTNQDLTVFIGVSTESTGAQKGFVKEVT